MMERSSCSPTTRRKPTSLCRRRTHSTPRPARLFTDLGGDSTFLVDNTPEGNQSNPRFGSGHRTMSDGIEFPPDGGGETNAPPETNGPSFTWPDPLVLANLQLVDPTNPPDSGTFFMYWDYLQSGEVPVPYPMNPYPQCNVYSLSTNADYYLVDDSAVDHSTNSSGDSDGGTVFSPQVGPGENDLWLYISLSNGCANLILSNTIAGTNYQILSKQDLSTGGWNVEAPLVGATNQNWTPITIPMAGRGTLMFWARTAIDQYGGQLWIELTGITNGLAYLTLHNTSPDATYVVEHDASTLPHPMDIPKHPYQYSRQRLHHHHRLDVEPAEPVYEGREHYE